ncbi:hypothetical protein DDP54_04745 [Cellulomonas sp. WB94]|uniref:hypothetical protein n=1 Tax=Cellulomonas sp. WB94 TaxID=2173174 RepID=UPI000D57F434|nr:hypothetical protein [Cellulomonas sp. WB94]PVU82427.1 hypothetical protein DDP54_04745 [Cellulomonas sp. WB94]
MSVTLGDGERADAGAGQVVTLRPRRGARGEPGRAGKLSRTAVGPASTPAGDPAAAPTADVVGRPLAGELADLLDALTDRGPVAPLRVELGDLLGAWASALVRIHRRPVDAGTRSAPLPWVLSQEPVPAWVTELPAVAGRAWAVRAHPATRRAVDEARAGWSASHRVHGEAGDDVVITRDANHAIPAAQLLPGASTGRGDARWDVASALDWIAVVLGPALDPGWQIDPVADFLAAYRALGGQAEPTRALAVARTIATAVEWSAALAADSASASADDHAWLAALWARPLDLVTGAAHLP